MSAANDPLSTAEPDVEPGLPPTRRFRTFDAVLDVPAFRWYLLSMMANWSGMQMQNFARGYLAYQITGSFAALGGIALANAIPRLLLALSGGVIADRASRRYVLQAGQFASFAITAWLAALLFAGRLTFNDLLIASVLQGIAMAFTMPARQAMIPQIVGPERLTNAFGLNATAMNGTRLLMPALAGVLVAVVGASWVFALMAAMFLLAFLAMFRVPKEPPAAAGAARPRGGGGRSGVGDIVEAFRYLRHQRVLATLLGVHLFVVLLTMPYQRLLPGFVDEVLATNESESAFILGLLLAVTGGGALIGSLVVASLPDRRRGLLLVGSMTMFALALLAFAWSGNVWLSVGIVLVLGFGQAGRQSLNQILIQTHVDDAYRGRISSIMMMEMGLESFGTFGFALFAAAFGGAWAFTLVAVGLVVVAAVIVFFLPSYRRLE